MNLPCPVSRTADGDKVQTIVLFYTNIRYSGPQLSAVNDNQDNICLKTLNTFRSPYIFIRTGLFTLRLKPGQMMLRTAGMDNWGVSLEEVFSFALRGATLTMTTYFGRWCFYIQPKNVNLLQGQNNCDKYF